MKLIAIVAGVSLWMILCAEAKAQKPPLLPEKDVAALANEVSGEAAKRDLEGIARFHRQRGSKGFHEAAELVAERLRAYGLSGVAILQFPSDGKIFYGTQRSRPAWDGESAELTEVDYIGPTPCGEEVLKKALHMMVDCANLFLWKITGYEAEPITLAEDSESAEVRGGLVDVGRGTEESDYEDKQVKGNFVLVSAQPGAAQDLAVGKYGAIGIISYAQNQKTAWWGEDQNLIRWGHLDTFSKNKTFAFMVSPKTARILQEKLARKELRLLMASVKAGQHPGNYEVVTATIPGADPKLKDEEIVFSCHLDHERPGANDNASGCAAILEVARTLAKLTSEKRLERPARTIRFVFPPEIEGTLALLNGEGAAVPITENVRDGDPRLHTLYENAFHMHGAALAKRVKAVIHMDMVGGGPETKAVFHVTSGPMSLPSFVQDVAWAFADWVNEESYKFAATGKADYPMVAPEGGKEPLRAEYSAFTMGSDHDVYQDSSFGIPAIYLNDWPDRYIHTNFDSAANIDPTKLKRAAFIGAASGYVLAKLSGGDALDLFPAMTQGRDQRRILFAKRFRQLDKEEATKLFRVTAQYDGKEALSWHEFSPSPKGVMQTPSDVQIGASNEAKTSGTSLVIYSRKKEPKGPLAVFGYNYFAERAKAAGIETPKLLSYEGLWGSGEEYAYEVLNFADGKRNAQEIRDAVSAEYGPVPVEIVVEYLKALEKIGVVAVTH
ncbi:MAG TPA: M28 family peptidase [Candidatus Acidoferrum sp.]|nr:M28 family peptidase [Candidatus Acidoferrum sp.]